MGGWSALAEVSVRRNLNRNLAEIFSGPGGKFLTRHGIVLRRGKVATCNKFVVSCDWVPLVKC